jgi:hypothetical protein
MSKGHDADIIKGAAVVMPGVGFFVGFFVSAIGFQGAGA